MCSCESNWPTVIVTRLFFGPNPFVCDSRAGQQRSSVPVVSEDGCGAYFGRHRPSVIVLALVIIVPNRWMLLKTITAFTVAHSITLALASLGFVNVPSGPTEAVIALSIVFLAVEIIHSRQGKFSLTERYPWIVAMTFGLFHGLGFAGALSEVGLPQHDIPLALLMFNVGVELGQIAFVLAILIVMSLLRLASTRLPAFAPAGRWQLVPHAIGCVAAYWTIERTMSFL